MWKWRQRRTEAVVESRPRELRGTPVRARVKSYSAQTGYVYQYLYRGFRTDEGGTDFVFDATRDRVHTTGVIVRIGAPALLDCEARLGRTLQPQEIYGVAKLTLFSAFDEVQSVGELEQVHSPSCDVIESHLRLLGRV